MIYSMSNMIIVNSLEFKRNIWSVLKLNSIQIYNPIKNDNLKKKLKINFFKNFKGVKILSIGRLTDQKNQITILKGLNILKKIRLIFDFI